MTPIVSGLNRPARILLTGASSGIGLALAERLRTDERVATLFLVSRHARRRWGTGATPVEAVPRLVALDADISSETGVAELGAAIRAETEGLDLIVNTVGFLHDARFKPEKSLSQVDLAGLQHAFRVNAIAPALLAKTMLPLLRHGGPAVFASLSARVGSIGDNRLGGWYGYRASKAAQNQLMKTFSVELQRVNRQALVLLLHPGTTETPLSQPFLAGVPPERLFSTERAAGHLLDVIARATPADNGRFLAWDGKEIPW